MQALARMLYQPSYHTLCGKGPYPHITCFEIPQEQMFSRFVPSIGSCSQFCLILQPHRVAVPFLPTFASPWRNSFVQTRGGTTLLEAKFGTTPQKQPKNDLNWGVGSSGRAASGGALAPEPPRATRNTPEFIRNLSKQTLFFSFCRVQPTQPV